MRILATLAAPSGLATAIRHHAGDKGLSWDALFKATGLTAEDWAALQAALDGVNVEHFLKFSTAAGVLFVAREAPINAISMGVVGQSFGPQIHTVYGDLK